MTTWRNCPLKQLVLFGNEVKGALIQRAGKEMLVRANLGVILAAGGFAWNAQLRHLHQSPTGTEWTLALPDDQGDGITAGTEVGASVALMDESWWAPTAINPATKERLFVIFERSLPHSIMVNAAGRCVMNEAGHYNNVVRAQQRENHHPKSIPMWMILDNQHRSRYLMTDVPSKYTPSSALSSGFIFKSNTIAELCDQIQVDPDCLAQTIREFNDMVASGTDTVHHRGDDIFDRYYGDPSRNGKNPNLGSIKEPPFYAVAIYPGDLEPKAVF